MRFANLHTHSHYSLLDGLSKIDSLVSYAHSVGMDALALTDHGVLYGAVEFYQQAKAVGIKPILGIEAYFTRGSRFDRTGHLDDRPNHLILLVKDRQGYSNLLKLVTASHLEGFYGKPRIDMVLLQQYHQGLICLTACVNGPIPSLIAAGQIEQARTMTKEFRQLFGKENFALEVQHRPTLPEQAIVNATLAGFSRQLDIPLVATNDSHYLHTDDAEAQDVLLCISLKKQVQDTDRMTLRDLDLSLLDGQAMAALFKEFPGAVAHSVTIADMVDFYFEFGKTILPHFEVPPKKTADDFLHELCQAALPAKYDHPVSDEVRERLTYELEVIAKTGFAPFFLIVADFVNWAKDHGIVVGPGRGSAAGSIVSYLLNITSVDPLRYELLFERFLNPDRIVMPDFDIDFADSRRDEVIRYVQQKYGKNNVAGIITFGTMAARAAVRDVGRVLGIPYSYCDRVAKMIPMFSNLTDAIRIVPELKDLYDADPQAKKLLETAKKLEGVARHASQHACGFIITKDPLDRTVPVQRTSGDADMLISQYSLHPIEDLGILKIDFLGLANLTILETTKSILKATRNIDLDLDNLPDTDQKTFELLQRGETIGVFQLESSGMRRYLRELKPTELEDITAMISLYRPGPMELISQFIAGKHGQYQPTYLDPRLKPILEKTHGVAVYQEQVMQMARDLAGFTMAEADVLRKAVGKKIAKLLKEQREKFIAGCVRNKIKRSTAEKIFDFIEPFARYGFNRAHAVCYAVIAYQTAYCKANYPAEFMAALLTADQANTDRIALEVDDCRRLGQEVLPPDVNESFSSFAVVPNADGSPPTRIRFGLNAIKNVGDHLVSTIIQERKANGQFQSLEDFLQRVQTKDLNRKSLESLIKTGALDSFGERQQMLDNIDDLLEVTKGAERESLQRQMNIFGALPTAHPPQIRLRAVEPANESERLAWEKQLLGFYVSGHPLDAYASYLEQSSTVMCNRLGECQPMERVIIVGVVTSVLRKVTRTAENMLFVTVEDRTGSVEVIVFPKTLRSNPEPWQEERIIRVQGKVSDKDGVVKVIADQGAIFTPPKSPASAQTVVLTIPNVADQTLWETMKQTFQKYPGPSQVVLVIDGQRRRIVTNYHVQVRSPLLNDLSRLLGEDAVSQLES